MTPAGLKRVDNPPNPFQGTLVEWIDAPPIVNLEVYEERAKSIVSKNSSPDIGFGHSVNPYRGCFHACAYCYARPTHQYLDFGAGTDFERRIVVKMNAPELLRKEFMKKSWRGDEIVFSGVTDCYQPLEASYEITRRCLAVCAEFQNPVSIITKGALIRRDIDILRQLNEKASVAVFMSIAFSDDKVSQLIEPHAPRPSTRFRAMKELADAGIPVNVGVAPVIPAVNDAQIPEILRRASEAGAKRAFMTLLRLPAEVKDVFEQRITEIYPDRHKKIFSQIRSMKNGKLNRTEWGKRMKGEGQEWEAIDFLFHSSCQKYGINRRDEKMIGEPEEKNTFVRPERQLSLF